MAHEVWAEYYDRLAALIREHRTTLVFVNTRKMSERVARHLSDRLGDDQVATHHGSLSKERRLDAETRLKNGAVRAVVATASLELGIDIGHVDLVCQIGSPRRIATLLQRVGRAGHTIHGTPKGRLFPETRDDLVECAALLMAVRRGELDRLVAVRRAARRAGAADRRRDRVPRVAGRRAVRDGAAGLAVPRAVARGFRRRDRHARRAASRPGAAGRPALIHRDEVHGRVLAQAVGAPDRAHLGRRDSRRRRLPRRARSRRAVHRHAQRRLRHREQCRRHLPARQQLLADPAGGRAASCASPMRTARRRRFRSGSAKRPAAATSCPRSSAIFGAACEPLADVAAEAAAAWLSRRESGVSRDGGRADRRVPRRIAAHPRRAADRGRRSCSNASSTIPAACSWCCTRRSAAASTARGHWRCASGSAGSSTSSCRRRRPKKGLLLSLGPQHAFPLADVFRYLHPSTVRRRPGAGVSRRAGVPDPLALERDHLAGRAAHRTAAGKCRRRCSGCGRTICWRPRFRMPRRASRTSPAIGRSRITRSSRRRCAIASKRRWTCRG